MPITLYGFQLWHYNKALLLYLLRVINKMQRRAALWIMGGFKTAPSMGIKAITGLIPINLYLQKIEGRSQLRAYSLPFNYILHSLMSSCYKSSLLQHTLSLNSLTRWQYNLIKDVTNFIQLVSPQPVDQFSQTKLHWKAPNEGYPHICGMYKGDNKWLRYQAISSCKSFVC